MVTSQTLMKFHFGILNSIRWLDWVRSDFRGFVNFTLFLRLKDLTFLYNMIYLGCSSCDQCSVMSHTTILRRFHRWSRRWFIYNFWGLRFYDFPMTRWFQTCCHFIFQIVQILLANELGERAYFLLMIQRDEVITKSSHFGVTVEHKFFFVFTLTLGQHCVLPS